MAFLTTYTQFVGDINVSNSAPSFSEGANLATMINTYEQEYLTEVLGYELFKAFDAAYNIVTPPVSGIWYDLANGAEFTDSLGRLNKWQGFKTAPFNPIAYYVYYRLLASNSIIITGHGASVAKTENSVIVSPTPKMIRAYNKMVDFTMILDDFLTVNIADYADYTGYVNGYQNGNMNFFKYQNLLGL